MKWFIVVIFMASEDYPLYIFTDPTFGSREECIASVTNPNHIPGYVNKLAEEYGYVPNITGINCINEDIYSKIYNESTI